MKLNLHKKYKLHFIIISSLRVPPQYNFHNRSQKEICSTLIIEESWRNLAKNCVLDKNGVVVHEAIWEIFKTERSYILKLKSAVDVYIAALCNLKSLGYFKDLSGTGRRKRE